MSIYTHLINNLEKLSLTKMKEILPNYIDSAVINDKPVVTFLKN